jgi:hypothetical protein
MIAGTHKRKEIVCLFRYDPSTTANDATGENDATNLGSRDNFIESYFNSAMELHFRKHMFPVLLFVMTATGYSQTVRQ